MVDFHQLSQVGFGCYRLRSTQNAAALEDAVRLGCNLVDTAATYTDGRSENLIGEMLAANPSTDIFVITKAGYGDGQDSSHYLDAGFLNNRLNRSLRRLRRQQVDAFLLHNPERFFQQHMSTDLLFEKLSIAFAFLEECVISGRIRFYGVSSNVLARSPISTLSLESYLSIARNTADPHHFRFIQFPCNLLEREAIDSTELDSSLASRAQAAGIVTIANRPLNALRSGHLIRLVNYPTALADRSEADNSMVRDFLDAIQEQLSLSGLTAEPFDFTVVRYICDHWDEIDTTDAVEHLFDGLFQDFLGKLYDGPIPDRHADTFARLYREALDNTRKKMSNRAEMVARELYADGLLDHSDDRSLQIRACAFLLNAGIDHVLVGMRDTQYVRELQALFEPAAGGFKEQV